VSLVSLGVGRLGFIVGRARLQASGKAKPQMDGWSDEGCREAGN
jgi:hypothetical protein